MLDADDFSRVCGIWSEELTAIHTGAHPREAGLTVRVQGRLVRQGLLWYTKGQGSTKWHVSIRALILIGLMVADNGS